ncbi:HipA domain-containing protein [Hyphomonas sp.]|uniref:HipA domain-containing protein n=1 Tax=Hyphomonas sp. TaxID=87 RepID=UPI0025BD12A7|nr:HipA domain-containing protein [Hyphomonas sp.]
MLYLVGENIDATTAHRKAQAGELVQVVRGVYVEAASDADQLLREFAVRIASYLYPHAYLCSASAVDLAPTADGRLFLSGRRNQRTRLRTLEIVQTQAPPAPSLDRATIGDRLGEFTMRVSSPEQRFLEAFRLRSEQASALTEPMRRAIAERLIAGHGTADKAADVLWTLARANQWYREGESAERYLKGHRPEMPGVRNLAAFTLEVAWHGEIIGHLHHDGHEWRWQPGNSDGPVLVRDPVPGTLPPFIESLLPEGWLATVLNDADQRSALRHGRRYLSNITVAESAAALAALPADILAGRLPAFTEEGVFSGTYRGPGRGHLNETFETNLARLFADKATPRLSGVQIKAPMFLDREGTLVPATDQPFTHILKPAGTSGFERMPVVEWLCLSLGRAAGFTVPAFALAPMPDDMPPALLVERFDIRQDEKDSRRFALEDFCSLLGLPAEDKYKGTIERAARSLRPLSTSPDEDLLILFERAVFAWLVADGDMHLKNIAVLKIAQGAGRRDFASVRMAPLYDALTTRVFPGFSEDRMALKLSGKDDNLHASDFFTLARVMGLSREMASASLTRLTCDLLDAVSAIALPDLIARSSDAASSSRKVMEIVRERSRDLKNQI